MKVFSSEKEAAHFYMTKIAEKLDLILYYYHTSFEADIFAFQFLDNFHNILGTFTPTLSEAVQKTYYRKVYNELKFFKEAYKEGRMKDGWN